MRCGQASERGQARRWLSRGDANRCTPPYVSAVARWHDLDSNTRHVAASTVSNRHMHPDKHH